MPGTTLRLDEVEHKMLQMLCLKTGRTQNQVLRGLLRKEFAAHGITRERAEQMMANPDRFWGVPHRPGPAVQGEARERLLAQIAAMYEVQPDDEAALDVN